MKVGKETETHPEVLMILNGNTGGGPGLNHWKSIMALVRILMLLKE